MSALHDVVQIAWGAGIFLAGLWVGRRERRQIRKKGSLQIFDEQLANDQVFLDDVHAAIVSSYRRQDAAAS